MTTLLIAIAISVVFSYLLGSVNSSIVVVRLLEKVDIRDYGSKNAGLTNTLRVFGKKAALFTLISDLFKGVIAVLISRLIASLFGVDNTLLVGYFGGLFAIIGHIFPVFYKFKGGKGVLIAATTLLALDPLTFFVVIPFFAIILFFTRYVSVSSMLAAIFYPIATYFLQLLRDFNNPHINALFAAIISVIIIILHIPNIKRLKNGTENKFLFSKK